MESTTEILVNQKQNTSFSSNTNNYKWMQTFDRKTLVNFWDWVEDVSFSQSRCCCYLRNKECCEVLFDGWPGLVADGGLWWTPTAHTGNMSQQWQSSIQTLNGSSSKSRNENSDILFSSLGSWRKPSSISCRGWATVSSDLWLSVDKCT